jgi:hypothetical protein
MHRTDEYIPLLSGEKLPVVGSWPSENSKAFPYAFDKINMQDLFGIGRTYRKSKCDCNEYKDCGCGGC